jgi:hypothetical protein
MAANPVYQESGVVKILPISNSLRRKGFQNDENVTMKYGHDNMTTQQQCGFIGSKFEKA